MEDNGKRRETVHSFPLGSQDCPGPILQRKTDGVYDFRPWELIPLILSPYSLEKWKKHIVLSPAHTAPCLLHTGLLVFPRRLGLVLVHAPWVIWPCSS